MNIGDKITWTHNAAREVGTVEVVQVSQVKVRTTSGRLATLPKSKFAALGVAPAK